MMRICKKCGDEKPLDEFRKHKDYKDGITNTCKKCHNEKNKSYPIDKERKAEKNKAWRLKNPDKVKKIHNKSSQKRWDTGKVQAYRSANKGRFLDYKREWREKHRDEENNRTRKWREDNPDAYKLSMRKTRVKRADANREMHKSYSERERNKIGDRYVISLIKKKQKISACLIRDYPELIEAKRLQIKLKRLIDEKRNRIEK